MIGKINYSNLQMSISGSTCDNIKFHVYKEQDGKNCSFWNEIVDLKIVDVVGYGQFELKLNKNNYFTISQKRSTITKEYKNTLKRRVRQQK